MTLSWAPPLGWLRGPIAGPLTDLRAAMLIRRTAPAATATLLDGSLSAWQVGERLSGGSDTTTVVLREAGGSGRSALLKATRSRSGRAQLMRQDAVLTALHADERLGSWRGLLPRILAAGEVNGAYCVLETRLGGDDARIVVADPDRRDLVRRGALDAIADLHRRTARVVPVSDADLARWIREPAEVVRPVLRGAYRAALDRMVTELVTSLQDRRVAVGWVHGDYTADNVLCGPAGSATAVVDWCQADPDGLAVLDPVSFLLALDTAVHKVELGTVVVRWLEAAGEVWGPLAEAQSGLGADPLGRGTLALLAWLRHIATNLSKSPRYGANPVWMHRNVRAVLRHRYRQPARARPEPPG
ncbi:aminoglycoside phosphotransferase family protein [Pseudonocardia hispaniensis]|uniref:Aminoglycoside phosphotransferase family protein n=1 Tax=Pseudonocardia hispaniensis TaxID=904933 RepID=A0ABW1IZM8_9PSEU